MSLEVCSCLKGSVSAPRPSSLCRSSQEGVGLALHGILNEKKGLKRLPSGIGRAQKAAKHARELRCRQRAGFFLASESLSPSCMRGDAEVRKPGLHQEKHRKPKILDHLDLSKAHTAAHLSSSNSSSMIWRSKIQVFLCGRSKTHAFPACLRHQITSF